MEVRSCRDGRAKAGLFWATNRKKDEDEEEKESSAIERDEDEDDDDDGSEESTKMGSSNKDGWPAMTYSPSRLQIIKSQRAT
ncbi:hypothetical protein GY631_5621 [Trichophyton interdigitale]|uniref:Uncharacterized protein n=1 Tax=Trichophyton interdigitale (strain MR816) TaxID=1215338 RepID=A0A059IYE1_TRIIM|nr:hypothetical protein GY631_5621 [Trichophyton interdigitale]KDB20237.1 hypothetical protein H109_07802 [Trichophyton interdigitale MR816]